MSALTKTVKESAKNFFSFDVASSAKTMNRFYCSEPSLRILSSEFLWRLDYKYLYSRGSTKNVKARRAWCFLFINTPYSRQMGNYSFYLPPESVNSLHTEV